MLPPHRVQMRRPNVVHATMTPMIATTTMNTIVAEVRLNSDGQVRTPKSVACLLSG